MIVIDASVLTEVLLDPRAAHRALLSWVPAGETLHAPYLIDLEVMQTIRRLALAGYLEAERGSRAALALARFPLVRYPHIELLARIWALRSNMTAYDAAYVALAEALQAPLFTRDGKLARAPGHRARVELV